MLFAQQLQQPFVLQDGSTALKIQFVAQHPNGYLLVATQSGLFEFDGIAFSKYAIDTAIGSMHVSSIGILGNGEVWAGFQNGALGKLAGKKVQNLAFQEGKFSKPVTKIVSDKLGRIWCATAGEGVYFYEHKKWYNCNNDDGMSDGYVYDLLEHNNTMLAATDAGINLIRIVGGKKRISFITSRDGLSDNITTALAFAPGNLLVAGHQDKGLTVLKLNGTEKYAVLQSNLPWNFGQVNGLSVVGEKLFICTGDSGLALANTTTNGISNLARVNGNTAGFNQRMLTDKSGNLWLIGNNQLMLSLVPHVSKRASLKNDDGQAVHAVYVDKVGSIWYGLHNEVRKISRQNNAAASYTLPLGFAQTEITSLYQDAAGIIWVGTMGNGVWLVDPATGAIKNLQDNNALKNSSILSISGKGNDIWLSSLEGALKCQAGVRLAANAWPAYSTTSINDINTIGTNYIYNIFVDSKNRVWFATDGKGLTLLENGKYKHFTRKNGLASDVVYGVAEDSQGKIWINVLNGGLHFYDGKTFGRLTTANGLSNDNIAALLADVSGNIIAISGNAIDVVDAKNLAVQHWGISQGVSNINTDLHSATALPPDGILFTTAHGFFELATNTPITSPLAYISSVELFLKEITWSATPHLFASDENNLGIHFNAIDFRQPEKVQFQYMLEGLGTDWITTKDRYVNFPKLPPGKYAFKVRASVNGAFANAKTVTYAFSIATPIWQRWWFIVLASMVLAAGIWTIIRIREKQMKHVQQLKQANLQSQLETLKSQVSPHFFFNSLNTLMALIEENKKSALSYTSHLSDFFRKIVQYQHEDTILLRDELALVDDYFFIQQQRFGAALQLNVAIDTGTKMQRRVAPLTLQLLVENAIKHNSFTQSNPLKIEISVQEGWLIVTNNLQPKLQSEPGAGMGLQNIQHRYQLITKRDVLVQQSQHQFTVTVPLI